MEKYADIFLKMSCGKRLQVRAAEYHKETGDMIHYIQNLKIRLKLYILVGVALAGMLIIGGMSFSLMGRMNDMTSDISTSWLPSIDTARELTNTLSNIRLNELGYLTAISEEVEASSLQYLQKEKENMDTLLAAYKEMIDEEESGFYEEAESLWSRYDAADEKMMELAGQGRTEEARAILEGECVELYNSLNGAFQEIITYNTEGSDDATEESFSLYRTAVCLMAAIIIAIILVGVFFSFVIIRLIKVPISEIENAAVRMAEGDLDVEISYTSRDEMGVLAEQVRRLIRKLQVIINDENKFLAKMAAGDFIPSAKENIPAVSIRCLSLFGALRRSSMTPCCRSARAPLRLQTDPNRCQAAPRRFLRERLSRQAQYRSWLLQSVRSLTR